MSFLLDKCTLRVLNYDNALDLTNFRCGNSDLDDFFAKDAVLYNQQLLGKTYFFTLDDRPSDIICAFTLSNDSIRVDSLPGSRKKKVNESIPWEKRMRRYPGILIGRFGINQDFKHQHIGTDAMNLIKQMACDAKSRSACRFLIVDAYNDPIPLSFYEANGFKFVFSSEQQEKEAYRGVDFLHTRLMFFDLIKLQ
ncbi:MAG: N-acetyltransferase [Bacteroidales bacterium]|nr:N-acetyltransferase [Bacteroidales bacterium]